MDFDLIKDMVNVITRNKVKEIEVLGNSGRDDRRVEQLYEAIGQGKISSDDDAAKLLFGTNSKDPNYKKLRVKLVRQLINASFFMDINQPMFNDAWKAFYNCYRDFAAAKIMISRGATKVGVFLLEQVLEQAIKYEIVDLTAEIARNLRMYYARALDDSVNHLRMTDLHRRYEEKRKMEMTALDSFEDLLHYYIKSRSTNEEVHLKAKKYFDDLFPYLQEVDTAMFYFYVYNIGLIKFTSANDCKNALQICNQALEILTRRKVLKGAIFNFAINKLSFLTHLRIFNDNQGEDTINFLKEITEVNNNNWFVLMGEILYHCLYSKRYEEALQVYAEVMKHPRFSLLSSPRKEVWDIYGAYLHLLALIGLLDSKSVIKAVGSFKMSRWSNSFTHLDKEKEGMNIPIIMFPVVFYLAAKEYDEFYKLADSMDKYRQRYLQNNRNLRSASFMKLMFALSERPFKPELANRRIEGEIKVLRSQTPEIAGQTYAVEIIPYEDLWEYLEAYVK